MAKISIEEEYKLLSQEEQILLRPDTTVGSIIEQEKNMWAAVNTKDLSNIQIRKQTLKYIPAFLKLFDEILTNASDHVQRGGGVKNIKVNITPEWEISVWNDGKGIPVTKHKEHKIWLPEMLLGRLNSGSNYNDKDERYGAGRNGLGSGLVSLFSSKFIIDCADGKNSYYQEITNNAKVRQEPIVKASSKSYTNVTYITDFNRMPIIGYEEATLKLCIKRVVDIAVYNPNVKVFFNDVLININSVKDWCQMHLPEETELFTEVINDKWSVGLAKSNNDVFENCSIVNGNTTWVGGTHVDSIMNNIVRRLIEDLTKGNKGIKIKPSDIKNSFHLFLVSRIANPIFDSQTKENLSIKIEDKIDISDKLYKALMKSEIIQSILEWVQMKEQMELNKMNKKVGGKTVRIDKLKDAHKAGTNDSYKCNLILCEGDSAAGTAIRGLTVVGRDYYGVFPLKGKPLNVRDAQISRISQNDELANVFQIIGLVPGKHYTNLAELRYGKVIFFTDADIDGYSIKGLLINMIHKLWPELLELGFCYEFITPIVISKKGKDKKEYFDLNKYKEDKDKGKLEGWYSKYYKGLGTINAEEIKEMFKDLDKHLIKFNYVPQRDSDNIDKLFNKVRVQDRRDWLLTYKGEIVPNKHGKPNQISDFIDTEFIQFSNGDNIRSIPQLIDGLKPTQRKILYAAFKKLGVNKKDEMKLAQFAAYTAEHTHYNHGEAGISGTAINMAQDFVGANNINLLMPSGEFGSRQNPNAAASPRYIFTYLNSITKKIFREEDNIILNYLDEDGYGIEPEYYYPIIPLVLMNGASGIGTGWSTDIPKYSPEALIEVIKRKVKKIDLKYKINPWYKDFLGDIDFNQEKNCYVTKGVFEKTKKGVIITELPIESWTENYIKFLDKLCDDKIIKDYVDNSTDLNIKIEVIFFPETKWTNEVIEAKLKLSTNLSMNNMHTFIDKKIIKWNSSEDMLNNWFQMRYEKYGERKQKQIGYLTSQLNKQLFIQAFIEFIIKGDLIINKKTKDQIIKQLENMEFDKYEDSYDYLLNVPVYWFSKEKLESIKEDIANKKQNLKDYKNLDPGDIWINELEDLKKELKKIGY